jgi:hypothetical protein
MNDQERRRRPPAQQDSLAHPSHAVAGPRNASLTQFAATLDQAPAVARTREASRLLRRAPSSTLPSAAMPVQRVVIDPKRPGWRLDKFDRPTQIHTDIAAKLGFQDDWIERLERRFPNLYADYVVPDNVMVDINILAEQAITQRFSSPANIAALSAARDAVGVVIAAASGALTAARVDYVVQGSGAQMLLGAAAHVAPDDVDIVVTDLVAASAALLRAGFVALQGAGAAPTGGSSAGSPASDGAAASAGSPAAMAASSSSASPAGAAATTATAGKAGGKPAAAGFAPHGIAMSKSTGFGLAARGIPMGKVEGGSLAVRKFRHQVTGKIVDLVIEREMTPAIAQIDRAKVDGVQALSPFEAILSLDYRIRMKGPRTKDIDALRVLATKNRADFTAAQQQRVGEILASLDRPPAVKG